MHLFVPEHHQSVPLNKVSFGTNGFRSRCLSREASRHYAKLLKLRSSLLKSHADAFFSVGISAQIVVVYNGVFVGAIIQLKLSLGNTLHSTNHSPPPGVCRVQVHVSEHVMLMCSLFCSTLSTVSALSNFPLVLFLYPLTLSSRSP